MLNVTTIEVSKTDGYGEAFIMVKRDSTVRTELAIRTWKAARDAMDDILQKLIEDEKPKE